MLEDNYWTFFEPRAEYYKNLFDRIDQAGSEKATSVIPVPSFLLQLFVTG